MRTLKQVLSAIVIVLFFCAAAFAAPGEGNSSKNAPFVSGELLVKFKADTANPVRDSVHAANGSQKVKRFKSIGVDHVRLPKGLSVESAIARYKADPRVEYAEPNYLVEVNAVPNDPFYSIMWDHNNTGQTGGTPSADIDAEAAWDYTTGDSGQVVVVIDTGIDYNHEDLTANMWTNPGEIPDNGIDDDGNGYIDDVHGWDAVTCLSYNLFGCTVTKSPDGDPMDDMGHGTHCAGTIGADGNNGVGIAGVNWNVKTMACKFLTSEGWGSISDAVACLDYVKTMKDAGVNIIATSNSWGGGGYSQTFYDALKVQMESDILFIAAAGNSNSNNDTYNNYPSNYKLPNVIAVAATDHNDEKPWWSSYGRHTVHVGAPGVDIPSLRAAGTNIYHDDQHFIPDGDPNAKYYRMSGTSMATPHVSGLAALVKAQDPNRSWAEVRNLVIAGGDDIASMQHGTISGKRINALGSLTCTDSPVFSALEYPAAEVGVPVTFTALSINCAQPVGPVTVEVPDGTVSLLDDGVAPDMVAGDGVFSGTWTPTSVDGTIVYFFPTGYYENPYFGISTYRLPAASTRVPYSETLEAVGGALPYTWSITAGTFPDGLTLNSTTGEISGQATTTGVFSFTVSVTDANLSETGRIMDITVRDDRVMELWKEIYEDLEANPADMAVDSAGNIYIAATTYIDYFRQNDYHIIKFDPSGQLVWERFADGGKNDSATAITIDDAGYIYVTGNSDQGDYTGASEDFYTIKYDPSGNVVWEQMYDNGDRDFATAIALDASGNVYVAGRYDLVYDHNALLVKFDASGNFVWAQPYTAGANTTAIWNDVAVDGSGNVYVVGVSSYLSTDTYLLFKYDSAGNVLWSKPFDGNTTALGYVEADDAGNVYIAGATSTEGGGNILLKYDASGNLLWTRVYSNPAGNGIVDMTMDTLGNIYLAGNASSEWQFITLKYDQDGNFFWEEIEDVYDYDNLAAIAVDADGHLYMTGQIYDPEQSIYTYHLFVRKYEIMFGIASTSMPWATVGVPYSQAILADGGVAPYTFSIAAGSLPGGLILNSVSGTIAGTPTTAGTFSFTVQGVDANNGTDSRDLSISVYDPLAVDTQALADGMKGTAYSGQLAASGGLAPYSWAVTSGTLPAGLSLNAATGEITGTPTTLGVSKFSVEVTDANTATASAQLSINVASISMYYIQTASGCAGKLYKNGPRYGTLSTSGSDCTTGDTIQWSFNGGPNDMLVGYLPNGGYAQDTDVTGQTTGSDLSFLAEGSSGTGYVHLVEVNPADGSVVQILSTVTVSLSADVTEHVTDISSLSGTVTAGNSFGIMLSMDSTARDANTIHWGQLNGGAGLEQWFTVLEKGRVPGACVPTGLPDSNCDGVDDDCDGTADDEYVTTPTSCGLGICSTSGQLECQSGVEVDTCLPLQGEIEGPFGDITCSDTLDNDCDGLTDDNDSDCQGGSCIPAPEICDDGIDNDCDGKTDCSDKPDCRQDPAC